MKQSMHKLKYIKFLIQECENIIQHIQNVEAQRLSQQMFCEGAAEYNPGNIEDTESTKTLELVTNFLKEEK